MWCSYICATPWVGETLRLLVYCSMGDIMFGASLSLYGHTHNLPFTKRLLLSTLVCIQNTKPLHMDNHACRMPRGVDQVRFPPPAQRRPDVLPSRSLLCSSAIWCTISRSRPAIQRVQTDLPSSARNQGKESLAESRDEMFGYTASFDGREPRCPADFSRCVSQTSELGGCVAMCPQWHALSVVT